LPTTTTPASFALSLLLQRTCFLKCTDDYLVVCEVQYGCSRRIHIWERCAPIKSHSCGSQGEAMQRDELIQESAFERVFTFLDPQWYPLQTRYQCEKRVDAALSSEGFESFAPMQRQIRRWSDRTKVVDAPLFPGYIFVRMDAVPELLVKVLRLPGLVRFVTSGRDLVAVPSEEIEAVRALVNSNTSYEPGPFPVIGEKVRIRGGCLDGIEGVLTAQTGRGEIVISVGAIGRSLKVAIADYEFERLPAV
jgi:transcription termination/antitermination protein NusG